jgi:hypothetical protein
MEQASGRATPLRPNAMMTIVDSTLSIHARENIDRRSSTIDTGRNGQKPVFVPRDNTCDSGGRDAEDQTAPFVHSEDEGESESPSRRVHRRSLPSEFTL